MLTAPEGYVLQLSGNIKTENARDKLTVYDNNAASGTKLLDEVSSSSNGDETASLSLEAPAVLHIKFFTYE